MEYDASGMATALTTWQETRENWLAYQTAWNRARLEVARACDELHCAWSDYLARFAAYAPEERARIRAELIAAHDQLAARIHDLRQEAICLRSQVDAQRRAARTLRPAGHARATESARPDDAFASAAVLPESAERVALRSGQLVSGDLHRQAQRVAAATLVGLRRGMLPGLAEVRQSGMRGAVFVQIVPTPATPLVVQTSYLSLATLQQLCADGPSAHVLCASGAIRSALRQVERMDPDAEIIVIVHLHGHVGVFRFAMPRDV